MTESLFPESAQAAVHAETHSVLLRYLLRLAGWNQGCMSRPGTWHQWLPWVKEAASPGSGNCGRLETAWTRPSL